MGFFICICIVILWLYIQFIACTPMFNVYTYTRFLTENISFYCIQFLPAQCSLWGSVAWDYSYCWSTGICTPLSLWLLRQPWLPTLDLDSCLCIFKQIKHHYHIYFWNIYVLIFSFLHPSEAFKMNLLCAYISVIYSRVSKTCFCRKINMHLLTLAVHVII